MYSLIRLIEILRLQVSQQLPELFLVLIRHEQPLQGHGAHLRPVVVIRLWASSSRPRQGPGQRLAAAAAAALCAAPASPVSISPTSPSRASVLSTRTTSASRFAMSGGGEKGETKMQERLKEKEDENCHSMTRIKIKDTYDDIRTKLPSLLFFIL